MPARRSSPISVDVYQRSSFPLLSAEFRFIFHFVVMVGRIGSYILLFLYFDLCFTPLITFDFLWESYYDCIIVGMSINHYGSLETRKIGNNLWKRTFWIDRELIFM